MLIHCLSPNPKCNFNSKFSHCHHHCNCSSECICLENNNIDTDNYNQNKIEGKLTYEIDSKGGLSPAPIIKKNQYMPYQNISPDHSLKKTNSLFNIREKIYKENMIKLNDTNLVQNSKNVLSKCKCGRISHKNRSCINKNIIRNTLNKKDELLEKIKIISNKIDNTINYYKEKKYSNNKINNKIKLDDLSLNFQYNNSKILESMTKENEKQSELTNPINIYKKLYNKDGESKKIKSNYAKLNKQKKFYIDNSINLIKLNDMKKTNKKKDISSYYKIPNRQVETEKYQISQEENIYNNPNNKKMKRINRNNSFDETINKIRTNDNNNIISNYLKKEIYKREIKNKEKNKKNYRTEENQQKNNKNNKYSKYIYTMRNKNEKYDNIYYKEIVHKKRDNSDSLVEMRNNKSLNMKNKHVINGENSDNNNIMIRNNSYDYKKNRKNNYNDNNLKINEINYSIINDNYENNNYEKSNENKIYYTNREHNSRNKENEDELNNNNIQENELYNNEKIDYQKESNYDIENNEEDIQSQNLINKELNNNIDIINLQKRNKELSEENEALKKSLENYFSIKLKNESYIKDLEQKLKNCYQKRKEIESANEELIKKIKIYENRTKEYITNKNKNKDFKEELENLKEILDKKEKDYKKIIISNNENKNNFDSLLIKHNNLIEKYNKLNKDNSLLKNDYEEIKKRYENLMKDINEINKQKNNINNENINNIRKYKELNKEYNNIKNKYEEIQNVSKNLEKQNKELKKLNEDKDNSINDLYKKNDINQKIIDNLNSEINTLNQEKSTETEKYNNINSLYKEVSKEVNKLEKKLKENDIVLINNKKENEKDINNLIDANKRYEVKYNELYNKLIKIQEELNGLKEENESLLNKNKSLSSNNESMLTDIKNNNEIITSFKEEIDELKKEIKRLNKENEKNKKENIELKNIIKSRKNENLNNSHNNSYEDEIVIVNKETTYRKGVLSEPNEFNKYGEIKNKYDIKTNNEVSQNELLKYHEIIQDASNLLYKKFFFKNKIKPKNVQELSCYWIVQYINEKFKKVKMNAFMRLFIYKEIQPKVRYIRKNNTNFKETKYGNRINSGLSEKINRKNIGYFNDSYNKSNA